MLKYIEAGRHAKVDTLVITPEFFKIVKQKVSRAKGANIYAPLYPWIPNWIVVSRTSEPLNTPAASFTLENLGGRFWFYIPTRQFDLFDGKVLGQAKGIVRTRIGFL